MAATLSIFAPDGHVPDHVGEACDDCGITHRRVEYLPEGPLTHDDEAALREREDVVYARGVAFIPPEASGYDVDDEATDHVVVSTAAATSVVTRYADVGWVVEHEVPHDGADPEKAGETVWEEAAGAFARQKFGTTDEPAFGGS